MLTVRQAAVRAGVSATLIYAWIASGQLAHFRVGRPGTRGGIRIAEADLDAFLASLKRGGKPEAPPAPAPRPKPVKLKHLHLN